MPGNVRKDDKARRIAFNILGAPSTGLTDSFGKKKRMKRKKELYDREEKGSGFKEGGHFS
jgi:hypothetical protein